MTGADGVPMSIAALHGAYRDGTLRPTQLVRALHARADACSDRNIWITRLPLEALLERASALEAQDPALPLYGIPFAIKDNIDLAGVATTAACPEFAYRPETSAPVVDRLLAAGAIALGKTNLDQFATGLAGTRSPYGICRNSFDPARISGGSSSGSAVAVALGLASFALGTDTAGSGRVPAAFNNLIGLKPTCGRLSPRGLVPACRTLDAISILTLSAEDAARVLRVAEGFDAQEPYSRRPPPLTRPWDGRAPFRFGVPERGQLAFFGECDYPRLFDASIAQLERLGGQRIDIDFEPFRAAAQLLYEGPWLAERWLVVEPLLRRAPEALHPVTQAIIRQGAGPSAADAFRAQYRLQQLRRAAEQVFECVEVLLTPTAPRHYGVDELLAEPVLLNSRLGYYTNFMNLLDLAAIAVPAGFTPAGLPFGVTLAGPAWSDDALLALGSQLQRALAPRAGASGHPLPEDAFDWNSGSPAVTLAVCGAHLSGLPLNHQLLERGGRLLETTRTAPEYRLYALPGGPPHRPGLVRVPDAGAAIELELWSLPAANVGAFVAAISSPLSIGRIVLEDGRQVSGFLCEAFAAGSARDITEYGGWRGYLRAEAAARPSAASPPTPARAPGTTRPWP